jgi:hypothetical protein
MVAADIRTEHPLKALLYTLADSPHATIETNRNCNIVCRICYNLDRESVKSLEEISEEINILTKKRKLSVITLLGGEPTLHPHLSAIVSLVKQRHLVCQLLTNGVAFLETNGIELLDDLASAGIDKVILHIDSGQGLLKSEIIARRFAIFSLLEARHIRFSLSLTLYTEDTEAIASAIRDYSCLRFFDGVLGVLARDSKPGHAEEMQMLDVYRKLETRLGVQPVAFIPSSRADDEVCWLIYMFYINCCTGRMIALSPWQNRLFRALYRFFYRRHFFVVSGRPGWAALQFLVTGLLSVFLQPASLPKLLRVMRHSSWLKHIRLHYIAVQEPPLFDAEENLVRICRLCPDATIRNGKLTPICIADYINPLRHSTEAVRFDWRRIAYGHLEEIG